MALTPGESFIETVPPPNAIPSGTSDYIAESIREGRRLRAEVHEIEREAAARSAVTAGRCEDAQSRLLRKIGWRQELSALGVPDPAEVQRYRHSNRYRIKDGVEFDGTLSRQEIIDRDEATCYLCGKVCEGSDIHLDHVIPLSKGGPHVAENLRVTCRSCNSRKGAKLLPVA